MSTKTNNVQVWIYAAALIAVVVGILVVFGGDGPSQGEMMLEHLRKP